MRSRTENERKARMFALASPVVLAAVIVAGASLLGLVTWIGGSAEGARVEIRATSGCPAEWQQLMSERASDIGIGEMEVSVEGSDAVLRGVLPGLEDDLTAIPELLTRSAELVITGEGEELAYNVDVTDAWMQMDIMGHPYVVLDMQPNALARLQGIDRIDFELDGDIVAHQNADEGEIEKVEMQPKLRTVEAEVRAATDWKILIGNGPGPCPVDAVETTVLTEAQ